jgi:hypothetical protein
LALLPSTLWGSSPWIRENTKKDIVLLDSLASSGAVPSFLKSKSDAELALTVPQNNAECTNLFTGSPVSTTAGVSSIVTADACSVMGDLLNYPDKLK